MERVEQRKVAGIERGLYLVHYAAAEDEARPPQVKVSLGNDEASDIDIVLHPDHATDIRCVRHRGSEAVWAVR